MYITEVPLRSVQEMAGVEISTANFGGRGLDLQFEDSHCMSSEIIAEQSS